MARCLKTIALIGLFCLPCATMYGSKGFFIEQSENNRASAMTDTVLPLVIKSCPGLEKYGDDLRRVKAVITQSTDSSYDDGLTIEFLVSDHPNYLPQPLDIYSRSNHCYIQVSKAQDKMFISKKACHSLCTGKWTENDPNSLGREFALK